jgi:hypothetical protein
MTAYDTPSGDLEVGQYALVGGAYTAHYPATTYTDATSTVEWPDRVVSGLTTDPVTGEPAPATQPPAIEAASGASTDTETELPPSPAATSSSTTEDVSTDTTQPEPNTSTSAESAPPAEDISDASASTTAP